MPIKITVVMKRVCLFDVWLWALFIMLSCAFPKMSYSDDFEYKIKAGLKEEFTDNLFFNEDKGLEAWSTILMTLAMLKNSSEILKTSLSGEWSRTVYEDYRDLNNDDWVVNSNLDWNPHEKASCSLDLSVGEDSNIDNYLSSTGLLLDTKKHEFRKGDISWSQRLSERLSSELAVSYTDESTVSHDEGQRDFTLTSRSVSAGMEFQINELTNFNLNSGYGFYDYDTSTVEQVYASLGLSRGVGEKLTFFCNMGSRYTTYAYDILVGIDMSTNPPEYIYDEVRYYSWGFIGKAGFGYKDEDSSMQLSVDESLQPSTGKAQSVERTSVDVSYDKRFTDDATCRMSTFYRLNRSDKADKLGDERSKTFGISSRLSYQLLDDLSLAGSYSFTEYRSSAYKAQKNVYRILLEYSF